MSKQELWTCHTTISSEVHPQTRLFAENLAHKYRHILKEVRVAPDDLRHNIDVIMLSVAHRRAKIYVNYNTNTVTLRCAYSFAWKEIWVSREMLVKNRKALDLELIRRCIINPEDV
jgi:hypothetical protein